MFCHNCGAQIEDDSVFCSECGAKIKDEKEEQVPVTKRKSEKIYGIASDVYKKIAKRDLRGDLENLLDKF